MLCTPGHTPDHACFELREEGSVFTGDCVLGGSSAVFEDLHDYMTSLKNVLAVARGRLYPGHGPVIEDGAEGIRSYIGHREARGGEGRGSAEAGEEVGRTASSSLWPWRKKRASKPHVGRIDAALLSGARGADRRRPRADVVVGPGARRARPRRAFSPRLVLPRCGLSPLGLVRRVYPRLPWTLRLAAAHNVAQHLHALQRQGRVARRAWLPLPRGYFRLIAMLASWWRLL